MRDRTAAPEMASDGYVRKLHRKMFSETWKWAGRYRTTEKNIGVPFPEIREPLMALFGDVRYWLEHRAYPTDEIAVRFHHRLVVIHPFPNGNGRHARLLADAFVMKHGLATFTWEARDLIKPGEARIRYLEGLHAADDGDMKLLIAFARM